MSHSLLVFKNLRAQVEEIDPDQEGWLVSYADLITLLFIFFALMLSISAVSKSKFEVLTQQFNRSTASSLSALKQKIDDKIQQENLAAQVTTEMGDDGLKIQFSEGLLFASGGADINELGIEVLGKFSKVLGTVPTQGFRIAIEGHTDSRPIQTKEFKSNWSLSSARAVSVLHFLAAGGLAEKSLMVRAFADTKPVSTDVLEKNRRVTLLVF